MSNSGEVPRACGPIAAPEDEDSPGMCYDYAERIPALSLMRCQVTTYSGHRLHERPLNFTWGEQWLEVREVLEQSYGPDHLCFKVAAADGRLYLLTYSQLGDFWEAKVWSRSG